MRKKGSGSEESDEFILYLRLTERAKHYAVLGLSFRDMAYGFNIMTVKLPCISNTCS